MVLVILVRMKLDILVTVYCLYLFGDVSVVYLKSWILILNTTEIIMKFRR